MSRYLNYLYANAKLQFVRLHKCSENYAIPSIRLDKITDELRYFDSVQKETSSLTMSCSGRAAMEPLTSFFSVQIVKYTGQLS